jgi:CheY-like chemotaxis protein
VSEVQTIVKTLANKKQISLEFETAIELPSLFADEAKFKQIMYNLFSNAIKFTPDGGKVQVTATIPTATGTNSNPAEQFLQVAVTDTGIGIAANDQERVFKEFEQVDSSYGRQQQGTGLGLALTKRLVEMHGGRIWVESEGIEGKGSTFTFLIPISQAEAGPPQPNGHPDGLDGDSRPLVLVVTNDDHHQQLLGNYLTAAGYDLLVVAETAALLAALKTRQPYAVLIDRKMGGSSHPPRQSQSDSADTLIQHKYRSCITPGIPQLIFTDDGKGRLMFNLSDEEGNVSKNTSFHLADAIQQLKRSTGQELETAPGLAPGMDDDPSFWNGLEKSLDGGTVESV